MFDDVSRRGSRDNFGAAEARDHRSIGLIVSSPRRASHIPGSPISLSAIVGEVGPRCTRAGSLAPRSLEVGPRLLKCLGGTVMVLQAVRVRLEAATPAPI